MIANKRIAIFGLAQEGISALEYLASKNDITLIDEKSEKEIDKQYFDNPLVRKAKLHLGKSYKAEKFDLVVHSAGIRPDHPRIKKLKELGAKVTSPTKIFFDECPGQIIGVTGTKGKGTTSTLIYEILKTKFSQVFLAGNIGTPMLSILPKLNISSKIVLELSSFQLMDLQKSPHIAVILMVTSEHLNWHTNLNEYLKAKASIIKFQSENDFAVINADYKSSMKFVSKARSKIFLFSTITKVNGIFLLRDTIVSTIGTKEQILSTKDILLPGAHNIQNVCAAVATAKIMGVENNKIVKVVKTFKGLEHRLQLVRDLNGVKYYNDSFSTTPETTIAAIASFSNPKILIIGGSSKNSDFTELVKVIYKEKTIRALILIGEEGKHINNLLKNFGYSGRIVMGQKSMSQIIEACVKIAKKGDVVLLSPAAASFDMFKNYKDRGQQFIEEVNKL